MEKILLDTDIGSDIDDAVCLAYLLYQPKCELLGITTVTGESQKRAMIASSLCKIAGKDIPIYPGAETPLLIPQKQKIAKQALALKHFKHDKKFPTGEAVEFLRRTIRNNPNEITLLTIAPLTNIALLFKTDPEIPLLLKRLVLMCGAFYYKFPELSLREWNAFIDAHATDIVYKSPVKSHRSIGQDVTCQLVISSKEIKKRFNSDILKAVLKYADIWFKEHKWIAFHDPLAAATVFDDKICQYERGKVEIELLSEKLQGLTYWKPGKKGPHEVAKTVDKERFFEHFFSILT
jgi:inosine-uridine nucleoside N-ribohydrolase